jgi:hypothetical protein
MTLLIAERTQLLFYSRNAGQLFVRPNDKSFSIAAVRIDCKESPPISVALFRAIP